MRRRFRERYNEASDRLERATVRTLAVLAVLLVVAQIFLVARGVSDLAGPLSELARTVRAGAAGESGQLPESYVIVRLLDHRSAWRAYLLVNGREIGSFRERELVAPVKDGDLVEVDGTAYAGAVTFRIVGASADINAPRVGDQITTRGSIEQFARVRR